MRYQGGPRVVVNQAAANAHPLYEIILAAMRRAEFDENFLRIRRGLCNLGKYGTWGDNL